jgi:hypothetical protein
MVLALFAIWKNKNRKVADKSKGIAELSREHRSALSIRYIFGLKNETI